MIKNNSLRIALIGAGQLGSRHLQAIAKLTCKMEIFVIDPSEESLKLSMTRFKEIHNENGQINIQYFNSLSKIQSQLDLAIIASNSDVRLMIIRELFATVKVRFLILEKVLFPRHEEYIEALNLSRKHETKVWVNCSRRMWDFYTKLKVLLSEEKMIAFTVFGGAWGLGSNFIHMVDLISFLTKSVTYKIESFDLLEDIFPSKRKGFIEFNGSIKGKFENDIQFNITSLNQNYLPFVIQIVTEKRICLINETIGKYYLSDSESNWDFVPKIFTVPYQSGLTHVLVKDIIEKNECSLTTFEESVNLHLPFIKYLNNYFGKRAKHVYSNFLIT